MTNGFEKDIQKRFELINLRLDALNKEKGLLEQEKELLTNLIKLWQTSPYDSLAEERRVTMHLTTPTVTKAQTPEFSPAAPTPPKNTTRFSHGKYNWEVLIESIPVVLSCEDKPLQVAEIKQGLEDLLGYEIVTPSIISYYLKKLKDSGKIKHDAEKQTYTVGRV